MCGIACIYKFDGIIGEHERTSFQNAVKLMNHRGPDSNKFITGENFLSYQNRLAIVNSKIPQPQPWQNQSDIYMYNGEVYNFDTYFEDERDAVEELFTLDDNSKYSFMISAIKIETKLDQITIITDFFGKKPLYYYFNEKSLFISSELKVIINYFFSINKPLNYSYSAELSLLLGGATHSDITLVEGVKKVEGNRKITFSSKGITKTSLIKRVLKASRTLIESLDIAVGRRLNSDFRPAFFFSGGIDSSIVLNSLHRQTLNNRVDLLFLENDTNQAEKEIAARLAQSIGQKLRVIRYQGGDDVYRRLKDLDHPTGDSSLLNMLSLFQASHDDYRVIITGDGGDEMFGGYAHYQWYKSFVNLDLGYSNLRFFDNLISFGRQKLTTRTLGLFSERAAHEQFYNRFFTVKELSSIYAGNTIEEVLNERLIFLSNIQGSILEKDRSTSMRELILSKVDSSSMTFHTEARSPLLDPMLIPYSSNNVYSGKEELKSILRNSVFSEALNLRKTGFGVNTKKVRSDLSKCFEIDIRFVQLLSNLNKLEKYGANTFKRRYVLYVLSIWKNHGAGKQLVH